MSHREYVVIGASAGGVEALRELVAALPADLPAAVLVVLHVPPNGHSALAGILDRAGPLPVRAAGEADEIRPGEILVAVPDRHLVVYDGHVTLSRGPRENGSRPAVDVLFRSAARTHGPKVIGVVLSGALDDGTAGLIAVRARGGVGVVQAPDDAMYDGMPASAVEHASPEHVVPVAEMAALIDKLVREPVEVASAPPASALMEVETAMAELDPSTIDDAGRPGVPAALSCPDCSGSLFRIEEGGLLRYRCRVGHAWSASSLVAQQASALETALWMALRTLEDKAALTREMAERAERAGHGITARRFHMQHEDALDAARAVRALLAGDLGTTTQQGA